jgi:predicted transcriptional regulator
MTEQAMKDKYKSQLATAMEQHRDNVRTLQKKAVARAKLQKTILDCLAQGPKTVPQIAQETSLDAQIVFWHIAALRKYQKVADGSKQGEYWSYTLKTES